MGSNVGVLNPKYIDRKTMTPVVPAIGKMVCYVCNKPLGKKYRDVQLIIGEDKKDKNNKGVIVQLYVHEKEECFYEFMLRFISICHHGEGRDKCNSKKKSKK